MRYLKKPHEISINFGRINQYIVLLVAFVISLIIGINGSTDVYERFNKLPDDRNELTPIKRIDVSMINGSTLFVHVQYDAIAKLTVTNLYSNINARIKFENISFTISSASTDAKLPSPESNFFEFTYQLPVFDSKLSVQIFLIDMPITKVYDFDAIKSYDENDELHQSYTTIHKNTLNNVCVINNRLQLFFKGRPVYNMNQLAIPNFQDYNQFISLKPKSNFTSEKAILIYSDPEKNENDPFSMAAAILHAYKTAKNYKKFIFNSHNEAVFHKLFDITSIPKEKTYCFSSLQIQDSYSQIDSVETLKSEILEKLKEKDSSSEQTFQTKQMISYFSNYGSSINNQNELFQAICPGCEVNQFSSSTKSIDVSNLYKIASSKIVFGFHSDLLSSAFSLYNTNNECAIIDVMPVGLHGCGKWIKNMKGAAKTIIYFVSNANGMNYNYFCNNNFEDCKSQKCSSLLNGNFNIDLEKIKKALDIKISDCPSNLISINETGVFCHNSDSFY